MRKRGRFVTSSLPRTIKMSNAIYKESQEIIPFIKENYHFNNPTIPFEVYTKPLKPRRIHKIAPKSHLLYLYRFCNLVIYQVGTYLNPRYFLSTSSFKPKKKAKLVKNVPFKTYLLLDLNNEQCRLIGPNVLNEHWVQLNFSKIGTYISHPRVTYKTKIESVHRVSERKETKHL